MNLHKNHFKLTLLYNSRDFEQFVQDKVYVSKIKFRNLVNAKTIKQLLYNFRWKFHKYKTVHFQRFK